MVSMNPECVCTSAHHLKSGRVKSAPTQEMFSLPNGLNRETKCIVREEAEIDSVRQYLKKALRKASKVRAVENYRGHRELKMTLTAIEDLRS